MTTKIEETIICEETYTTVEPVEEKPVPTSYKVTIDVPLEFKFGVSVSETHVPIDIRKLHSTTLVTVLAHGISRKLRDGKVEKDDALVAKIKSVIAGWERGEEYKRGSGSTSAMISDPLESMVLANAKTFLLHQFASATGFTKFADICAANANAAVYFQTFGKVTAWDNKKVLEYVIKSKALPGGRDYFAEAKSALDGQAAF